MIIRSYTGRTVDEALLKVRSSLGDRALILETRPVREPGLFGTRSGVEVVAAGDDAEEAGGALDRPLPTPARMALDRISTHADAGEPRRAPERDVHMQSELLAIRRQLERLAAGSRTPTNHLGDALANHLAEHELPSEHIAELDEAVASAGDRLPAERREAFCAALLARGLDRLKPIDWGTCRALLMVGPTGVGKTTTIAKLASHLVLEQHKRVALVTIDTYRVGGQDQLRAYADLLDAPFAVANTPAQLAEAMERFTDVDHVLVDTSGRSPTDTARVHELRGFCRAAPGMQVMLAVAAVAGRPEFASVVERFSLLPIVHAVVTKLDECAATGRLYGCLRRHRLPVTHLTTGQEVPADIASAEPRLVIDRLLPAAVRR